MDIVEIFSKFAKHFSFIIIFNVHNDFVFVFFSFQNFCLFHLQRSETLLCLMNILGVGKLRIRWAGIFFL